MLINCWVLLTLYTTLMHTKTILQQFVLVVDMHYIEGAPIILLLKFETSATARGVHGPDLPGQVCASPV